MTTQTELDLNNLPPVAEAEQIIKGMDSETTLAYINMIRQRTVASPEDVSEEESIIGMHLVRHLRTLKETKRTTRSAAPKKDAPLTDLL